MTIILFTGAGQSAKMFGFNFINNKYIKNNFLERLKKIDKVIIPDLIYKHIYYYQKNDIYNQKKYYKPIKKLTLENISIEKTIKNMKIDNRKKYIVIGYSDGIYFAMEFAKQYSKLTKEIISLDGSWITIKLCNQRLINWKNKGKKVKLINSQKKLDNILDKIINKNNDNDNSIKQIMYHKRYEHTKICIKNKYQNIIKNIKFTIFRDFNSKINNDIDKQFNEYTIFENDILSKISNKYQIFWLTDASHILWSKKKYEKQIINYIKSLK
jgi:hypothetical protein